MKLLAPNQTNSKRVLYIAVAIQLVLLLTVWELQPRAVLPGFSDIWQAQLDLKDDGLIAEMIKSFSLNLEALGCTTLISLGLAYLSVVEIFRPAVAAVGKLRFLPLVGLTYVFTSFATSPHELKVSMLVFSIGVFFVAGMATVIASIPREQYDLARTLRMGPWEQVWEVVILGQMDQAFDQLRLNAAIGWMMLTMVESAVQSEGGIGAIMMNQTKHFRLEVIFALMLDMLIVGYLQDLGIVYLKKWFCPYADLTVEKH